MAKNRLIELLNKPKRRKASMELSRGYSRSRSRSGSSRSSSGSSSSSSSSSGGRSSKLGSFQSFQSFSNMFIPRCHPPGLVAPRLEQASHREQPLIPTPGAVGPPDDLQDRLDLATRLVKLLWCSRHFCSCVAARLDPMASPPRPAAPSKSPSPALICFRSSTL